MAYRAHSNRKCCHISAEISGTERTQSKQNWNQVWPMCLEEKADLDNRMDLRRRLRLSKGCRAKNLGVVTVEAGVLRKSGNITFPGT